VWQIDRTKELVFVITIKEFNYQSKQTNQTLLGGTIGNTIWVDDCIIIKVNNLWFEKKIKQTKQSRERETYKDLCTVTAKNNLMRE